MFEARQQYLPALTLTFSQTRFLHIKGYPDASLVMLSINKKTHTYILSQTLEPSYTSPGGHETATEESNLVREYAILHVCAPISASNTWPVSSTNNAFSTTVHTYTQRAKSQQTRVHIPFFDTSITPPNETNNPTITRTQVQIQHSEEDGSSCQLGHIGSLLGPVCVRESSSLRIRTIHISLRTKHHGARTEYIESSTKYTPPHPTSPSCFSFSYFTFLPGVPLPPTTKKHQNPRCSAQDSNFTVLFDFVSITISIQQSNSQSYDSYDFALVSPDKKTLVLRVVSNKSLDQVCHSSSTTRSSTTP